MSCGCDVCDSLGVAVVDVVLESHSSNDTGGDITGPSNSASGSRDEGDALGGVDIAAVCSPGLDIGSVAAYPCIHEYKYTCCVYFTL